MIQSIHISNYALIDSIDINLYPGLNIITGQTGAGKSIILGALGILLGGRVDFKVVRNPEIKSVIEATFTINNIPELPQLFAELDIDWDPETIILRREINPNGRSRAFVNDTPVNLAALQSIATLLVDIHSQNRNSQLADAGFQLQIIDSVADNEKERAAYQEAYTAYRKALRNYKELQQKINRLRADEDYMRFRFERLNEANLIEGEQQYLEQQKLQLSIEETIHNNLVKTVSALTDDNISAQLQIETAIEGASAIADIMPESRQLLERLEPLLVELDDIGDSYSKLLGKINFDPDAIDEVNSRLELLTDLTFRNNVQSPDELISLRDELEKNLNELEESQDLLADLRKVAVTAKHNAVEKGTMLTESRKHAAVKFGEALQHTAMPLGMPNLQVDIQITPAELSKTGADAVDFRFAFNKNQTPMPIADNASGGEVSRLMLSIKALAAKKVSMPAILFDEVDTGVSGEVADKMGALMQELGNNLQVITITHLPQVAARGRNHFRVYKEDTETATVTQLRQLAPEERIGEIAAMLSGSDVGPDALAQASRLLDASGNLS